MSKPILRVGKIKASGTSTAGSVGAHLARSRPTPNADPAKTALNRTLIGAADQSLDAAISAVMAKGRVDPAGLRKDAVRANDIMLSLSPDFFRPDDPEEHGAYDPARLAAFESAATEFLRKTFGGRVAKAVLHLDEATPHIHAVVVPLMPRLDADGQKAGWRLASCDMFGPTALSALQQGWEDQVRPYGVEARTKGSTARHTTLKEFYGTLEAFRADRVVRPVQIGSPPPRGFLEGPTAHRERVDQWRKDEVKRLKAERKPLEVEASRGRLYEAERRASTALRGELGATGDEVGRLRESLADAMTTADLDKAQIARLRSTPINEVAARLGVAGPIGAKENAIDLVKRAGGLGYAEALAWLHQQFGAETTATAAREYVEAHVAEIAARPVQTAAEKVKARAMTQQLDALAAPAYRVTIMAQHDGRKVAKNLGKGKGQDGGEQLYSREDILAMIPQLTAENARGGNIFLTPIDAAAWHVLVDDLTADKLAEMRQQGYTPSTVLESSPGSFQMILKVPKRGMDEAAANEFFKDVNRSRGDQAITGLAHPFRIAAFQNRKAKHQDAEGRFPYVRLVEASNRLCQRAMAVIRDYANRNVQDLRGPRR